MKKEFNTQTHTDKNAYAYEVVDNDPNQVRIYTLKNGLKVYLAQNTDAPRIQTYIPVRTGSNADPADNTGLAHYLEHMMFKGTSKIGSKDWAKEKPLLDQISALYEEHKAEQDPEKKKEIYRRIDEVSQEAAQYALANEYDKLLSSIGASGTNAHTWFDETVYKNNIPNNELEKWLKIESERFSELVLRLFHTELEAVYEEFNRAQDNDTRLVYYALLDGLFPVHPNGQQTTLGSAEHLKNPSMKAIHQYFNTFYVPNNMAVILVGDLDFEASIQLVDQYFGELQYHELPQKNLITEEPLKKVKEIKVKSPSSPRLQLAWRTDSYATKESKLAEIAAQILSNNGETGLLDVNINQAQKALRAVAYNSPLKYYGYTTMVIIPKENQSLDDAKKLLWQEIEKLQKGDFPDWLIPAIVQDMRLSKLRQLETADGLATMLYESFIRERDWEAENNDLAEFEEITKDEIIKFANDFFQENYVIVYKEQGENENLIRVDNPGITPVTLNKVDQSKFLQSILKEEVETIKPVFVNYQKLILEEQINGVKTSYVKNPVNELGQLNFIFDFGTDHDKEIGLALSYLEYLGTDQFSSEDLKAEFFKIGIAYEAKIGADRVNIQLSGLEENLVKGVALLLDWYQNVKPDQEVYAETVQTILESREYTKKDKGRIGQALNTYAKLGPNSRLRDIVSKERLSEIQASELTQKIQHLMDFPYQLYFYGNDFAKLKNDLVPYVKVGKAIVPEPKKFVEQATSGKVYFTNYDMVQVEYCKIGRGELVDPKSFGSVNVFNEYFGRGLSSIVFQEIRESRSLAYSAYVSYSYPNDLEKHDYITSYIGTQTNKLAQAVSAMDDLMTEMPLIPNQFENAKENALKQIASTRINRRSLFFQYLTVQRYGLTHDIREDIYHEIQSLNLDKLNHFYQTKVASMQYNTAILGKKESLDQEILHKIGDFQELTLEDIFGY